MFDKDGSGTISLNEIRSIIGFNVVYQKAIEAMIKEVDENGDGEISMEEFKTFMNKLLS
jgi:Ca2+-binding EF-hand superfamily protein